MKVLVKNNSLILLFLSFIFCTSLSVFSQTKKDHETKIRELHRIHMEASINHDIETLRTLMHDDIIWYLGADTLRGKEKAIVPHEYDAGYKTILKYSNVVVKDDTVRFDLLETNDQVKFFGMEGIRLYPQFIFKDGLVYRKMQWKKSGDMPELIRRSQPFINWVKTMHPEALKIIRKPNGRFNFNFETGRLLLQLFHQWRDEYAELFNSIKARHEIATKAIKEEDIKTYINNFTEDGIYMWPGEPAISGREALREWFTKRFANFYPEIDRTIEEIIICGDWAFERGKEDVNIKNNSTGNIQTIKGKYINILQQQEEGSWKVHRRIRNLDYQLAEEN